MLLQYTTVRIKALLHPPAKYNGWHVNRRAPTVGDRGAIVEILRTPQHKEVYVVECVNPDGSAEWVAELSEAELESVTPNKRIESAPYGRPTHKQRGCLLAAHSRR